MKNFDLNLLRFLDSVYRARSVTRAAELLDMTQPTASQKLLKLRRALGDPLFTRAPGGVKPTPFMEQLVPTLRTGLAALDEVLDRNRAFEPRTSQATYRFYMSDNGEARFLPPLVQACAAAAPHVSIEVLSLAHAELANALNDGRIDFALGYFPFMTDVQQRELHRDRYVILMSADHPFLRGTRRRHVRQHELAQLSFVAVPAHTEPTNALQGLGVKEQIRQVVSRTQGQLEMVKKTRLCAVTAHAFAECFVTQGGLRIVECDFPTPELVISLYWSRRFEKLAHLQWMREQVARSIRAETAAPADGTLPRKARRQPAPASGTRR